MSEQRHISEPGETIQVAKPSWAPAFFALGATGAVAGIYANGFVFSAFIWSYVGIVILLAAFRVLVKNGTRGYFSLPRRQQPKSAALPMEQITLPARIDQPR